MVPELFHCQIAELHNQVLSRDVHELRSLVRELDSEYLALTRCAMILQTSVHGLRRRRSVVLC